MAIDIGQDLVPTDAAITRISELAVLQLQLETELADAEEKFNAAAERLRQVQERELPDALIAAGVEELKLANGAKLTVNEDLKISVGQERMPRVCAWLKRNNHDDIIKRECTISLPKGTDPKLIARIEKGLKVLQVEYSIKENVHSQTLKALLKEQVADPKKAKNINLSDFGAFPFKKAVIKLPKNNTGE
jgi:hypothetical protein